MYSRLIELGSTDFELYEAAIQCAYMCDRYDEMEELSQKALASGLSEDQVVSAKKWLGIAQLEMKIRRSSHSLWSFSELIRMQSLKRAEIEAAETHFIQND